ncbi:calcium-binding and coiled-coil domain-containing protein 2 isoform X1 [Limanda limanda]|uniref:calcium-binding and coiled-coil domain-containing protein 2 isoform X1 n=1 Tax=Limanda limanda TaxID=27771 RepID=UPI0029C615C1|nr:calcium-binding and coiled-coil domain-containing protein 2 isoform X1 [Limanda limanda]
MEGPSGAAAAPPPVRTFSQVVFSNIPQSYPPSTSLTCHYTAAFQPHPRDWVGIFKVGWNSAKDYHTFVWVEPGLDVVGQESVSRQTVFKDYYLPKDEMEFYQFCYIDVTGQVRGASTPFCFKSPEEQSLTSRLDDDILVVTTQEQVDQSVRERDELQKDLDQIRQENETLKLALEKEQQDAAVLKEQNEEKEREKSHLVEEMGQNKEEIENLTSTLQQKLQEMSTLKEELLAQITKHLELEQHRASEQETLSLSSDRAAAENQKHTQEKYDRAVMKINQMKDEQKALKGTIDVQSQEIAKLNCKVREGERELLKTEDSVQLLQVDLQSSEKQKDRLDAELQRLTLNMEEVKRENQQLCRRLTQQETQQQSAEDPGSAAGPLQARCQALASQLQDAQVKLATERDDTRNTKRQVVALNEELSHMKRQLENTVAVCDEDRRKSNKLELQLREALEALVDKDGFIEETEQKMRLVRQENEALTRENNDLRSNMEGLRSAYADLNAAPTGDSPHVQPAAAAPAANTSSPPAPEHLYHVIADVAEPEEELLVCRHCQESFPGITRGELEQHEESHRVCPFCTVICDLMEQSVFEDHVYSHNL